MTITDRNAGYAGLKLGEANFHNIRREILHGIWRSFRSPRIGHLTRHDLEPASRLPPCSTKRFAAHHAKYSASGLKGAASDGVNIDYEK